MDYKRDLNPDSVERFYRDRTVAIAPDEVLPPEARPAAAKAREAMERTEVAASAVSSASSALREARDAYSAAVDAAARDGEPIPADDGTLPLAEALKLAIAEHEALQRAQGEAISEYVQLAERHAEAWIRGVTERVADHRRRLDEALIEAAEASHAIDAELGAVGWLDNLNWREWMTVPFRSRPALDMEALWPSAATPSLEVLREALLAGVDRATAEAMHDFSNRLVVTAQHDDLAWVSPHPHHYP